MLGNNRWMLRVLDAPAAVAARGFPRAVRAEVHLELHDRLAPWHAGRHVLCVEDGEGSLRPGGQGDVQVGPNGLAALFSGFADAYALRRVGLLHHGDERALASLSAAFAGPHPTIADDF